MNLIELNRSLRQLRLGGIAAVLETRLQQAQAEPMAPIDFLSCLVCDELTRRGERLLERRRKQAQFSSFEQEWACTRNSDQRPVASAPTALRIKARFRGAPTSLRLLSFYGRANAPPSLPNETLKSEKPKLGELS
jgi:hypothetical protein